MSIPLLAHIALPPADSPISPWRMHSTVCQPVAHPTHPHPSPGSSALLMLSPSACPRLASGWLLATCCLFAVSS